MANSKYEYVKKFEEDDRLPPSNWIVVRIDGCHFHRFSAEHEFEKPNDEKALNLMNACALAMLEQFPDIVFAYGVSDEYSFIWKETTVFYQRRASKMLSLCVSYFTSMYVSKWKDFFPHKELKGPPYFDGRVVCYPKSKIIRDYLAWRQVDCKCIHIGIKSLFSKEKPVQLIQKLNHAKPTWISIFSSDFVGHINNQYNTCFWMLVKSGKTEKEAQEFLKGTQAKDKNELLFQQFGINYDKLPQIFRKGSSVYREKVENIVKVDGNGNPVRRMQSEVVVDHMDIIGPKFWSEHPYILKEE